ncbi:Hypothetical predicted protein [Marmota monax]|nr:hypothetical protein GHT09_011442 [Marmota monax]VTJ82281.1 Hypothetical predicted protein [Marmota monax]
MFPTQPDASTSMTPESEPTNITTDAPSSSGPTTVPMSTDLMSTQMPSSETPPSSDSVTTPHMPGSTNLPPTTKPNSSPPTVTTSSKLTHPTPPTTRSPETPVSTMKTPTTLTSPGTTLTATQMTTVSRTTPGNCDNGGTWEQGQCSCRPGFSGDRCQHKDIGCQNGGKWDGLKCLCPTTFYGPLCEFPAEQLELGTVEAEVGMEVSVDQEFSPDLNDNTSKAYRDFNKTFQDQMMKIYKGVQGFRAVKILSLRSGSIVVDYLVLLELSFSLQLESQYEKVKTVLKEKLQSVIQDGDSCQHNQTLCFKPNSVKVNEDIRTELTPKAICSRAAAKGYEEFYFPLVEQNRLRCVTNCTPGVDGAIDCGQGQCLLERSGPVCRCFSTDTHWFSGSRCEMAIHWRALVGGLAGGAGVLLLLLGLLSVWLVRSRGKDRQLRGQSWDEDRQWFEIWDEDTVGTFSNIGFEDDRIVNDESFHVALDNVDTSTKVRGQREDAKDLSQLQCQISPSHWPSGQPTQVVPSSQSLSPYTLWQVHIQRPEMASSSL